MSRVRNMITAIRYSWAVRSGPCFHPFYCCKADPGHRWWFGGRP